MKLITDHEVAIWVARRGIEKRERKLMFSNPHGPWIVFESPVSAKERIALCEDLRLLGNSNESASHLLWISTWRIWSDWFDDFGEFMVDHLRGQPGAVMPLSEKSGHILGRNDAMLATAILWQTLLFNWDAYLVPESGEHIVECSHDELVWVMCKTDEAHEQALTDLSRWKPRTREFIVAK